MANIILCGGKINQTNLPVSSNQSNALVPINGKPVIGWILDDLIAKDIKQATIVLRAEEQKFQSFLQRAYAKRMSLNLVLLKDEGTIVHSLLAGLEDAQPKGQVRIILGDTLIRDSFVDQADFVYTGKVDDSRRWCVAVSDSNGLIRDLIDKRDLPGGPHTALAGYYHLIHGEYLLECALKSVATGGRELSDVLLKYNNKYPISTRQASDWFDFGHIDNFVDARWRLIQPRYFNSLSFNPILNTVTKNSRNTEKLMDELMWYQNIPDRLKVLTPRLIEYTQNDGELQITQEYYGYPTLAELYVYGEMPLDTWTSIIRRVLRIHHEFRSYPGHVDYDQARQMYLEKTQHRLSEMQSLDDNWRSILSRDYLWLNGRKLQNYNLLYPALERAIEKLVSTVKGTVIHGDLCFSNILYDLNNQIVRLIDPRGSFGRKGIYGDPRYDIAKLRHSVSGLYDFIVADLFEIEESDGSFRAAVFSDNLPEALTERLDNLIIDSGYDVREIRLIEGLLFLSMVPLHNDRPQRQQLMYLTGLKLLNEVLIDENSD